MIGIKELHGKLGTIAAATRRGKSFLVMRHAEPVFRIEPIQSPNQKTYTLEDIKKISFHGQDEKLSKKVDEIVYHL